MTEQTVEMQQQWIELRAGVPWASPQQLNRIARQQGLCLAMAQASVYDEICQAVSLPSDDVNALTQAYLAKQGIRKYVDDVTFRVNKHSRDTLRQIQRDLRDANLARAQEMSATATATLRAAQSAMKSDETSRTQRLSELDASLDQLDRLRKASIQLEQR